MAEIKGIKTYKLTICYNDATDVIEFIRESVDGTYKCLYYGDLDISLYFDEEALSYKDEFYEVGDS